MNSTELAPVKEEKRELSHMTNPRLDDSLFSKDLAPHYMQLASKLASSELVPKSFRGKPQDLFLCWALGYQIGMSPEQAMQCIAIINGRACMWGDEMLALCMAHKDFDDILEEPILKDSSVVGYTCTVKRKGRAPKINVFTLDMAKKAGLLAKGGVWNQYPERMLKLRARGFCLRDAFPDALKGIHSREEVEDYIDAEYKVVDDKVSRTEFLKKDYLTKTGQLNDEIMEPNPDIPNQEETAQGKDCENLDEAGIQEAVLHAEIKRLLDEKGYSEERLAKALHYYEVDCIESLNVELAGHFIEQLHKS